ncbi:hypothetical protein BDU57DRAFT_592107 [Ampelomyces quisqualis]|uniref:Methyltransferase n=1 Tax=Ampelomyces quisqualis TaxID=50730 RepID=A0A6A5R0M9_AMPQU|nr:hypothetical protein BDU57DRAFT_592107 [Ampelomyces quisqualis]
MPPFQTNRLKFIRNQPLYDHERPYMILAHTEEGQQRTNVEYETGPVQTIQDARGREESFTLDKHGFAFVKANTEMDECLSRDRIEILYLAQMRGMLKGHLDGADHVEFIDWRKRSSRKLHGEKEYIDVGNPSDPARPISEVHVDLSERADFSPACILNRVEKIMGDRTDSLLKGRVQVINIWRPLEVVKNWPLVVCDGSSIRDEDLLEIDLVRRDWAGYTLNPVYRPGYRWFHLSDQHPDELILFKMFDSSEEVDATSCPHASVPYEGIDEDRDSIEVRALVFTLPEGR